MEESMEYLGTSGRPLTRRQVLAGAGSLAMSGALLSACGGSDSSSPTTTAGAAAGTPKRGGVLTFAVNASYAGEPLDPARATGPSQYLLNASVFDTLTYVNPDGWTLEPRLAESWEPGSDLKSWQIKLREGVTFHNGQPLTAKDVAWSLKRVLDEEVGSNAYARLARTMTPEGIKAVDDRTLEITLKSPDSLLPYAFGVPHVAIVPDGQSKFGAGDTVGTGPFRIVTWVAGQSWELERNPEYWDPKLPYLDGMRKVVATEEAAASQGVTAGEFDVAEAVSYASAKNLGENSDAQLVRLRNTGSLVIVMDAMQAPFTDEDVRMAFKLAVNREIVLSTVYAEYGDVTSDLVLPPGDAYYPPDLGVREYDPEQAKSLLARAGHADGIDIDLITSTNMTPLAVAYGQTVKDAGINVTVKQGPRDTYWERVYLKKPFYTTDWQQLFPGDFLWYVYGSASPYNESHLKLAEIDDLYTQCLQTEDADTQKSLIQQGLALASNQMGHIIPVSADSLLLAKKNVRGVTGSPYYRYYLREAYLA
jgi:peptide/nickel transport system substrate-binding protein